MEKVDNTECLKKDNTLFLLTLVYIKKQTNSNNNKNTIHNPTHIHLKTMLVISTLIPCREIYFYFQYHDDESHSIKNLVSFFVNFFETPCVPSLPHLLCSLSKTVIPQVWSAHYRMFHKNINLTN